MASEDNVKKRAPSPVLSPMVKLYLFSYNALQFLGWSYLLYQVVIHYASGKDSSSLWEAVKFTLMVFQNAAVLEVLHVMLGLVKSNVVITAMQVASRVMVVCGVLSVTPTAPRSIGLLLLLIAWSVTEIIRYLYYAVNIYTKVPFFIVWCRYTFFYVLYPVGVTGELLCFYAAQKFVKQHHLWSMDLPNVANFTFSYHYFQLAIMASYLPLFPRLYLHMVSQRKKIIGGESGRK
ncbi:unnamed protein product [Nezara viridula]|uniref:Very-long-chain (3R)-3-hydroxyacyl-CoA dehydratase n=1 Tax=Nezara viridula TaxID=85310 RepID=A0A9P0HJU1_NEZVI|nr:unnamed protein product [Nezara viridula]